MAEGHVMNLSKVEKLAIQLESLGDMAQLVARFHGMEEVRGSIPLISTSHNHRLFTYCEFLFSDLD